MSCCDQHVVHQREPMKTHPRGNYAPLFSHLLQIGIILTLLCVLVVTAASQSSIPVVTGNARVDKLLSEMTLEEKMALIRGDSEPPATNQGQAGYLPGVPRLGIPPIRMSEMEAQLKTLPEDRRQKMAALCDSLRANYKKMKANVDATLEDKEELPYCGGITVIYTPGHTPGHLVLFLPRHHALVTGDTLTAPMGRVGAPTRQYTPVPRQAVQSLKKLSEFDFEILVPYHWPPITSGAGKAVKKYLDTLE